MVVWDGLFRVTLFNKDSSDLKIGRAAVRAFAKQFVQVSVGLI
jgi:hypothetical protein